MQRASNVLGLTRIVWDVATQEEARRYHLGSVDVPQIAFVAGGQQLLTADSAGRLLVWDVPPAAKGKAKSAKKK
uniref:WD40 repeat domain-containing protein n=1 Tax=Schlesneria paludicola TaxID=360056 RepID=A0A7C2JZZ4_9PLAN